jgi:hypothetical protein
MHFPRKFSAAPFVRPRSKHLLLPGRIPIRRCAQQCRPDSNPSGGRRAYAQLHGLSSTPASTVASPVGGHQFPGVNVHGPRDSDSRMRTQR